MKKSDWESLRDLRAAVDKAERSLGVDSMRRQPFIDALPEIVKALVEIDERLAKIEALG